MASRPDAPRRWCPSWRLHIDTGLPVSAVSPAIPLPGMRRAAARTGSGTPSVVATRSRCRSAGFQPVDHRPCRRRSAGPRPRAPRETARRRAAGKGGAHRLDEWRWLHVLLRPPEDVVPRRFVRHGGPLRSRPVVGTGRPGAPPRARRRAGHRVSRDRRRAGGWRRGPGPAGPARRAGRSRSPLGSPAPSAGSASVSPNPATAHAARAGSPAPAMRSASSSGMPAIRLTTARRMSRRPGRGRAG